MARVDSSESPVEKSPRGLLFEELRSFRESNGITTKGPLSVVIQLTEMLSAQSGPWSPDDFIAKRQGQVAGLGGPRLKRILASHGITRTLASEGGRTSRGTMSLMPKYISLINKLLSQGMLDFPAIAEFWADAVRDYFNNLPFTLSADSAKTLTSNFDELFDQVRQRQTDIPGSQYLGTVLQHLVGAKLSLLLHDTAPPTHGSSVADAPTGRGGDFIVNDIVIHCTTAPGGSLIDKCKENLAAGARPIIITLFQRVRTALDLATDAGLGGRVEVWDIQQFLTTNIHEWSAFDTKSRNAKLSEIIDRYNEIVTIEHDPSLRIEFNASRSQPDVSG